MISEIIAKTREKMEKALQIAEENLETIKIGRARPALVENIRVEAYEGTTLTLKELASISVAGAQELIISPWDKSIIKKIAQAISQSELQLNPLVGREVIRIKIPPLTEERKQEILRLIQMKTEGGRKMIRAIRNEAKTEIEQLKGESGVSDDDIFRSLKDLQELHDEFIEKLEAMAQAKKTEIGL